jgi:alkyl sulfatase BDS1-like metallo-beta-lactamase superfamily hydrolase
MKPAHPHTQALMAATTQGLDFSDERDFDDVRRGFVGTIDDAHTVDDQGGVAWSMKPYRFLEGDVPDTVHPSLWRNARLNAVHGLFKVTDRIYQVRGFSLANVTFVEGDTGVIVIDPLTYVENARAAHALYTRHRGERPVRAIIYTHSHRDHYGGAAGIVAAQHAQAQGLAVIAPLGFLEEAFSETMLAGVPMRRRSLFQFGTTLTPGPMGQVDCGLGKAVGRGRDGLIPPNRLIREPIEQFTIDGLTFVFHLTPGTEAPAEMNIHLPDLRALNLAENACHTMHNLCPLRGAKTRDALAWSRYLDQALQRFARQVDVVYAQHQWPVWGAQHIHEFMAGQRDLYRYLHDQTLRLMSHGMTPAEIGERLMMPGQLSRQWFARGYYGAVVHNVAAIYAHYMGPYDGNPANLHPLAPEEEGARYVEAMGGADRVVRLAKDAFDRGEFRWVVELLKHVVFSQPEHAEGRALHADAMEQLGYQSESSTWRNAYLLGAQELRQPRQRSTHTTIPISADMIGMLPLERFLEFLAIRVDGQRAQTLQVRFDWTLTDDEHGQAPQHQQVVLSNGALSHLPGLHEQPADAHIVTTRQQLSALMRGADAAMQALDDGAIDCRGDIGRFRQFLQTLDVFDPMFNVVEP